MVTRTDTRPWWGTKVIDAVRLGITSVNPSWNPNQEQIQEGTSPTVLYISL